MYRKVRTILVTVAIVVRSASSGPGAEVRTWTGRNGVQVQAEYIRTVGGVVVLRRGVRVVKVPLGVLSDQDLAYLRDTQGLVLPQETAPERGDSSFGERNAAEARRWTDASGTYRIDADFIDLQDGLVRLKKKDGRAVSVQIGKLNEECQRRAKLLATASTFSVTPSQVVHAAKPSFWREGRIRILSSGNGDPVYAVTFSPDGRIAATGDCLGRVFLWDVSSGQLKAELPIQFKDSAISFLKFTPDGNSLVTCCCPTETLSMADVKILADRKAGVGTGLRLWDIEGRRRIHDFGGANRAYFGGAITPDGKKVLATTGSAIDIFDLQSGKHLGSLSATVGAAKVLCPSARSKVPDDATLGCGNDVVISWDGKIAMTAQSGFPMLWDIQRLSLARVFQTSNANFLGGPSVMLGYGFVPGTQQCLVAYQNVRFAGMDHSLHILDCAADPWNRESDSHDLVTQPFFLPQIQCLQLPPWRMKLYPLADGKRIVVGSEMATGNLSSLVDALQGLGDVLSDDEDRKERAISEVRSTLHVCHLNGEETRRFETNCGLLKCMDVSRDGWLAITGHLSGLVCLWGIPE